MTLLSPPDLPSQSTPSQTRRSRQTYPASVRGPRLRSSSVKGTSPEDLFSFRSALPGAHDDGGGDPIKPEGSERREERSKSPWEEGHTLTCTCTHTDTYVRTHVCAHRERDGCIKRERGRDRQRQSNDERRRDRPTRGLRHVHGARGKRRRVERDPETQRQREERARETYTDGKRDNQ